MAIETISNGESGLSARGKINETITKTNQQDTSLGDLNSRVAELESNPANVSSFGMVEITDPVNVPEDDSSWTDVLDIQRSDMPIDGRYFVNITQVISPNTSSKKYIIRQVDNGVAYEGVSEEASANDLRSMEIFRTYYDVINGVMDFKIQIQLEEGQGSTDLVVEYVLADYECKIPA